MKRARCALFLFNSLLLSSFADFAPHCWHRLVQTQEFVAASKRLSVCNQGDTPYCAIYAAKTFLEAWSLSKALHSGALFTATAPQPWNAIDPAFIALSYNLEVGSGSEGHLSRALSLVLRKHGILPLPGKEGVSRLRHEWNESWPEWHLESLWSASKARQVMSDGTLEGVSATDYLNRDISLDDFRWFIRTFAGGGNKNSAEAEDIPALYRYGTQKATLSALQTAVGSTLSETNVSQSHLATILLHQLRSGYPVLGTINDTFEDGALSEVHFLSTARFTPYDLEPHAVAFLTYCTEDLADTYFCRPFAREIRSGGACVVIQNSWGEAAHRFGRLCVTPKALKALLRSALIHTDFVY